MESCGQTARQRIQVLVNVAQPGGTPILVQQDNHSGKRRSGRRCAPADKHLPSAPDDVGVVKYGCGQRNIGNISSSVIRNTWPSLPPGFWKECAAASSARCEAGGNEIGIVPRGFRDVSQG